MPNHLLKLIDLSKDEIFDILYLARKVKMDKRRGIIERPLDGKTLGMIFEKSSTRTRVSFQVGMYELGGQALFLSTNDLQLGRGESIRDTARVLSRYLDGIMIRTFEQSKLEELAEHGTIPIINGLTDLWHPCQVLADLQTIAEYKGDFSGLKLCYIGDGNNMANSLIVGSLKVGMSVAVASPEGYRPCAEALTFAENEVSNFGAEFTLTDDPYKAAKNADILVTDVWASMGQEAEREERKKVFSGYQINSDLLKAANPGAMVLHCLPAHKGEEISETVFEEHAGEIFEEAENRLHAQKAVMIRLMASS